MNLRTRVILGQLPLIAALVVVCVLALLTVRWQGGSAEIILTNNYRSVLAAQRMKETLERMDSASLFLLAGERARGEAQIRAQRLRFEEELQVEEGNVTESGEQEAVQFLRAAWQRYQSALDTHLALTEPEPLHAHYFQFLEPLFLKVKRGADAVLAINQDAMLRKSDQVKRLTREVSAWMTLTAAGALLLGLAGSVALIGRILRPVTVLTHTAHRLGAGDLDARATVHGPGELVVLGRELNALAERIQHYQRSSLGQLLQAQLAAQAAIDSIPDPVLLFGIEGQMLNVNRAAEERLGVHIQAEAADPLGQLSPSIRQALQQARMHVLEGRGSYSPSGFEEAVAASSLSGELWLLPRAEPVYGEKEGIIGATVILQDVTRLRRFNELKNDLVAAVAHEFRTPLTSLHMAIHLLAEALAGPLTEAQQELLLAAREDCERLQRIVNDLLDLARIQSGRVQMTLVPTEPAELVHGAVEAARDTASAQGIGLSAEVLTLDQRVLAEPQRVALVFSNLISNALRHTPPQGTVVVRARSQSEGVRFEVSDSGEGIAPEHQRQLFERFFQVPGARHGSAGLGLSICQEIVRAHGGQLGVESALGEGSTFWFVLPEGG